MIASAISANDVMVDLNLSANRIGMKGLGLVLKALSSSKSIKSLNVSILFGENLSALYVKCCAPIWDNYILSYQIGESESYNIRRTSCRRPDNIGTPRMWSTIYRISGNDWGWLLKNIIYLLVI